MNGAHSLRHLLTETFPDAIVMVDEPASPDGSWFVDIRQKGREASVAWRPTLGFSISSRSDVVYGEEGDENYPDTESTFWRIAEILRRGIETRPPRRAALRDLRELRQLSQEDLAERLMVTQGTVSRMERRPDMFISTLRAAVEAMGGELEILVKFEGKDFRITQFEESSSAVVPAEDSLGSE